VLGGREGEGDKQWTFVAVAYIATLHLTAIYETSMVEEVD
jgi:hypothetical protein